MNGKIFIVSLVLLTFFSCSKKKDSYQEIIYDTSELNTVEPVKPITKVLPLNFELTNPTQLQFVNDSLFVVFDESSNGRFAHLFKKGKYIVSFGVRGKAKGEMLTPQKCSISKDRRSIYFYDYTLAKSVRFDITDLLKGNSNPKVLDIDKMSSHIINRFNNVWHFSDDSFIGYGYDEKCRVLSVENGKVVDNYVNYPIVDKNAEYNHSIWSNMTLTAISKDQRHLVITTGIGMLFEIFDLAGGKVSSEVVKGFYKPEFGVAQGAKPACVIGNEKTFYGFTVLCASNDGFYGCVMGGAPNYDKANVIYYFNYKGKLEKVYCLPNKIVCMDVNENNEMYVIVVDKKGVSRLEKVLLK